MNIIIFVIIISIFSFNFSKEDSQVIKLLEDIEYLLKKEEKDFLSEKKPDDAKPKVKKSDEIENVKQACLQKCEDAKIKCHKRTYPGSATAQGQCDEDFCDCKNKCGVPCD